MDEELPSSQLGTKEYWDDFYKIELENFKDHEECGEVWFGMESVRRISRWMSHNITDKSTSMLDLGCGNGMVLLELEEQGYKTLTGVDYSQAAIDLAISLADGKQITYKAGDLLRLESSEILQVTYDILIDKGTYDAISLSPHTAQQNRLSYLANVRKLLNIGGLLWITSCNWTSKELSAHFAHTGQFELKEEVPVKQFQYGGQVGQTVCCLVFKAV